MSLLGPVNVKYLRRAMLAAQSEAQRKRRPRRVRATPVAYYWGYGVDVWYVSREHYYAVPVALMPALVWLER